MDQYIGQRKIEMVAEDGSFKTPLGNDVVIVHFTDGDKETYSKKTFELIVSNEPVEDKLAAQKKLGPLLKQLMYVVLEYDIRVNQVESLVLFLQSELKNHYNRAINYRLTGEDKEFVPGMDIENSIAITMLDVTRIINEIPGINKQADTQ